MRLTVDAHIGDGIEPDLRGGLDGAAVCNFAPILTAAPMASSPTTFSRLWSSWQWRPIRNCAGRFCLVHEVSALIWDTPTTLHRVRNARDLVIVAKFVDGGLISYVREGGTLMHTLNTPDGLARKLRQLGIDYLSPWSRSIIASYSSHRSPQAVSQCAKDQQPAATQYHRIEPEAG